MSIELHDEVASLRTEINNTKLDIGFIHKDLQNINQSMAKIANAVEVLASVQMNIKVLEERSETRHKDNKEMFKLLHSRIDETNKTVKELHQEDDDYRKDVSKGTLAYKAMLWFLGTVGTLLFTGLGTLIYRVLTYGAN